MGGSGALADAGRSEDNRQTAIALTEYLASAGKSLGSLLEAWDEDGDGSISRYEFWKGWADVLQGNPGLGIPRSEIAIFYDALDPAGTGNITIAQMSEGLVTLAREAGSSSLEEQGLAGVAADELLEEEVGDDDPKLLSVVPASPSRLMPAPGLLRKAEKGVGGVLGSSARVSQRAAKAVGGAAGVVGGAAGVVAVKGSKDMLNSLGQSSKDMLGSFSVQVAAAQARAQSMLLIMGRKLNLTEEELLPAAPGREAEPAAAPPRRGAVGWLAHARRGSAVGAPQQAPALPGSPTATATTTSSGSPK